MPAVASFSAPSAAAAVASAGLGKDTALPAPSTGPRNIGALIIRIGFWGPSNYSHTKEPPKNSIV